MSRSESSVPNLLMRAVRRKDTAPGLVLRRALHAAGLRDRWHVKGLPGSPDLVLPRRQTVVFVDGCLWHGHDCAHGRVKSKANSEFWETKTSANKRRDQKNCAAFPRVGWAVETMWECQVRDVAAIARLICRLTAR